MMIFFHSGYYRLFFSVADLPHTGHAFSAVEKHNASAIMLSCLPTHNLLPFSTVLLIGEGAVQ